MLVKGRYLIQQFIDNQHRGMRDLYSKACNSLRITVAHEGKELRVLGCMCMLGAHGIDCSNCGISAVSL